MGIQPPVMLFSSNRNSYPSIPGFSHHKGMSFLLEEEKTTPSYLDIKKEDIKDAIQRDDIRKLIDLSNRAYKLSGRYAKIVNTSANLFRYDYLVTPVCKKKPNKDTLVNTFYDILLMLEEFNPKLTFQQWAKEVIKNGSYYGYKNYDADGNLTIQDLPIKYCLSVFKVGKKDLVHFDMTYFIDTYRGYSPEIIESIIKAFPTEMQNALVKLSKGQLPLTTIKNKTGYWITLDIERTIKFSLEDTDIPYFIQVLPSLIEYDESKNLVKRRYKNSLNSILANQFPMRKEVDAPLVDINDMKDFNNQVNSELQQRTEGVFSISTIADTKLLSNNTQGNSNEGEKMLGASKDDIYDEAGLSQMQFNSDSSSALQASFANDEANISPLIQKFEIFLNELVEDFLKRKKIKGLAGCTFKVQILETTCYNYLELSAKFKEQTQLGYSKVLPQIALGQSQLSVLSTPEFENDVLDLVNKFIPPMMSSTMSGNIKDTQQNQKKTGVEQPKVNTKQNGRPKTENPTDKTLKNQEAINRKGSKK